LQLIKGNVGSVRIVRDEAQPDKFLPDVSLAYFGLKISRLKEVFFGKQFL
jgi:hypothetical protein